MKLACLFCILIEYQLSAHIYFISVVEEIPMLNTMFRASSHAMFYCVLQLQEDDSCVFILKYTTHKAKLGKITWSLVICDLGGLDFFCKHNTFSENDHLDLQNVPKCNWELPSTYRKSFKTPLKIRKSVNEAQLLKIRFCNRMACGAHLLRCFKLFKCVWSQAVLILFNIDPV